MDQENKIRTILNFILFDYGSFIIKNNELITFAQLVKDVFKNWINRENRFIVTYTYKELPFKPDSDEIVFYKKDRIKFASALFLYCVIPFYKFRTHKKDKHGELIYELLDSLIKGEEFNKAHIKNFNLEYYWNEETSLYLYKIKEIMEMDEDTFKNLPDFDSWLNKLN